MVSSCGMLIRIDVGVGLLVSGLRVGFMVF